MKTFTTYAEKKAKQILNLLQGYTKGIRFTAILILLLMGVSNTWAGPSFSGGYVYFHNKGGWNDNYKYLCIGKSNYTELRSMSVVTNTQLWCNSLPTSGWNDATYMAVIGNSSSWGSGSWGTSNLKNANHRTASVNLGSWGFNSNNTQMLTPANGNNDAALALTYVGSGYASMNNTITIKAKVSTNGGSSYSDANTPAKLTGSSKVFTSFTSCAGTSGASATLNAGSSSTTFKAGYTANTTLTAVAATGYTFAGWYTDSKVSSDLKPTVNPAGATTYYAYYKAHQYTVKFDANEGSGTMSNQSYTYGVSQALTANAFTRAGYTFEGWNTNADGTGTKYTDKQEVSNLSSTDGATITLYAQWTEKTYSLTFEHDGNGTIQVGGETVNSGSNATVNHVTTKTLVATPNTGYNFSGWTLSGNNTSAVTIGNTSAASTTIKATNTGATVTANFTPKTYNITYTAPTNGSYTIKVGDNAAVSANTTANYKTTITLTNTPDPGYHFSKWTITPNVSITNNRTFLMPASDVKIDATFEADTYTITWNANGGSVSPESSSYTYNGDPIVLPQPTRDGYTFLGWFTSANGGDKINDVGKDNKPTSDVEYFAQWTKNKYTVAYGVVGAANGTIALNNETPAIKDQNKQDFEHGTRLTFTATPADGYRVLEPQGWFSDEEGNTLLGNGNGTAKTYTINSLTDAASVFVAFEKIPASTYIVTFDANGGDDGTMNSQSFTENEPQNLTTNAFTRTGYTFSGWNTQADGTGDSYADGQSVTLTTAGLTLYAQWTANQYTITLDKQGGTDGTSEVVVHYDNNDYSANPVDVPSIQGYAFMGYYVAEKGSGFQVVDATGNWVKSAHGYTDDSGNWKKASDITLYAHFEKAQVSITLDKEIFESGTTEYVVASHTIAPTPAGTTKVCWGLCYSNGSPVAGHEPIEDGDKIKFPLEGLSAGSYKVVATLYLGNECGGEELSKAEATFVVAGSYTVTIKYTCDGQEIAGRTTIKGHPSRQTEVTAAVIGGYNFVKWELGDGISTTDALTDQTIYITANYEGYLTATYEKKKLIFLDLSKKFGQTDWPAPHIYLYSEEFWDETKGTGATDSKCVAKGAMSPVPGTTGMWFYEYEGVNNFNGYVAFTPTDKMSQANFYDTEVIHRGDFSIGTPVFVPAVGQTANIKNENKSEGKNAQYYNKGHWTKYMGGTGYTLKIYNHKEAEGRKELMSVPFTGSSLYLPFTAVVDLEAGQTFGYKIVRDNDKWYKNDADGTMTVNSHTNWPFIEDKNNGLACGIQTVAAGIHTFTLTLNATSGNFEVTVDYPVTVGDYRILYKDNTRTTYKPSDIKKAEELNPVTSFFIRPNSNPELKIQTAARIFEEGVTWANSNGIYFKPNSQWKEANARFAAYFYNGSKNEWKELTQNGDIYSCEKPSGYTHVIFVRLDPAGRGNSTKNNGLHWDYKWTQTINLSLPTDGKNFYSLEEGAWRGQIYLKPNSNWTQGNARFAAYFFEKYNDETTKAEWHSMFKEDDGTYWCGIPDGCSNVVFCRMNPAHSDNRWNTNEDTDETKRVWNQTSDLTVPTDGKLLYTVKAGTWDKGGGTWTVGEGTWNKITGSITDLTEELKKKLGEINGDIGKAPDSVYTIHLEQNNGTFSVAKVVPYTGNFYIRVDAAAGKWYDYKTNPDNLMTYSAFSESDANSFGEKFSHYKTEWCSDGMNVKFVIANDYSPCISDTLVQDEDNPFNNINENGNLTNEYNYNANIRFMWNRSTNKVSRAYVASATNPNLKFLVLKTNENIQDKDGKEVKEVIFQDTQNWIYEYTIKAKPGTRVKLYACYPTDDESKAQHFRGEYNTPTTFDENNSVQILGGTGEAWNTIRVLYDFKTNRLMGAWVPESAISTEQAIAADLMVIRRHQEDATCVTLTNENSKLTDVKTAYGAMQFNRWTINNRGGADDLDVKHCTKLIGSHRVYDEDTTNLYHPILQLAEQKSIYERGLYFISFPFDVHLSDVFGFGTYGTHWVISTYNGKRRAERGYFAEDCINEDCTNWDYIWDPSGFVMKANEGYLLSLDLDLMKHDNPDFWANNIGQVELFFPSTAAVKSIEKTDYTMPPLGEEYLCKINHNTQDGDRRVKDSYWRCIGVPSFADYDGSLTTDGESTINWKADYTWKADNGAFPFLYEWNVTNNDLVVRSTNSYKFRATYAYLIQNGNEIHWEAVNTNKPASIIARDQTENVSNYEWKIALLRNDAPADHTFIRMTDNESVTSAFDFHQDLSKEFNYGANIYTLVGYERLAANSLPMSDSTTIIPLGVSAQEAGDYTIAMPEGVENIGITLVDNETGIHTNLSAGQEYTLTLNKGICENRLFIEVSPIQQSTTDLEYTTEDTREQTTRKMLIDGMLYLIRDGVIYDAQGHRL